MVVVDRPARPGNLGTIIRTADALGATAVLTTGHGAHLYDPQTVRASVGSLFALPTMPVASNQALVPLMAIAPSEASTTGTTSGASGSVNRWIAFQPATAAATA